MNYLLGHKFTLRYGAHIADVEDKTIPHSAIANWNVDEPSTLPTCSFSELQVLQLDENTYLCELPAELESRNHAFIPDFSEFIEKHPARCQLIIISSLADWMVRKDPLIISSGLECFHFLITEKKIDFVSVLNNKGDNRMTTAYYKAECRINKEKVPGYVEKLQQEFDLKKTSLRERFFKGEPREELAYQALFDNLTAILHANNMIVDSILDSMENDGNNAFIWQDLTSNCKDLVLARLKASEALAASASTPSMAALN